MAVLCCGKWSALLCSAFAWHAWAGPDAAHLIHLASTNWPPYTSAAAHEQGAATAVVRAALAAAGYGLQVDFYPWRRAIALAARDQRYVGYFPEYQTPAATRDFVLSAPIGEGPLGFAERVDAPVHWQRLDDLAQYRVGVVQGYVNTGEFDRRVASGEQPVDIARDDTQNLLKLVARRVPLAAIDRRVFEYVIRHDPKLMPFAAELRFNDRLLENKKLYVAFRPGAEGERARRALNDGLKKINAMAVMEAALR